MMKAYLLPLLSVLHLQVGLATLVASRECPCDFCPDGIANISNEIRDVDPEYTSCPYRIYNKDLNAANVVELDLDMDVVMNIRADFEADVEPHLGYSTDDICMVDPYDPENDVWNQGDDVFRSNAKWYSMRNEKTYQKYLRHVEALGLRDLFKGKWIDADEVTVYGMFFLVRSRSEVHHMHWDWQSDIHTQLVTFLLPVKDIDIHLVYQDINNNVRPYEYKVGKGIGFAGGFMHSTDTGHSDTDDVLFSVYLGGSDPDVWEYFQESSADELEYYMHPEKGYIENELYGETDNCHPKKGDVANDAEYDDEEYDDSDYDNEYDG